MSSPIFTEAAIVLTVVGILAIALVRWWSNERALGLWSYAMIPFLGVIAAVLAACIEPAVIPHGLHQRLSDISLLACLGASIEEVIKAAALFFALRRRRALGLTAAGGVAVGMLIGLGFSILENLAYATKLPSWWFVAGRAVLSTPGHAVYTGILAFILVRSPASKSRAVLGLMLAILAHALFDWLGLLPQLFEDRRVPTLVFRLMQVVLLYGTLARFSAVRTHEPLLAVARLLRREAVFGLRSS